MKPVPLPPFRLILTSLAVCAAVCFSGVSSFADTLTMGSVLPNYAVVSVGSKASLTVNSGPIVGSVLVGDSSSVISSGGGNGKVTGTLDVSGTVSGDLLQNLQTPATINHVLATIGTQAVSDATALSSMAAGLTATQIYAAINGTQVIHGNGGTNVIDIASLHNPKLTITGGTNDLFIFNVAGLFNTNQPITLTGVSASQILWNLTGTGTVFQTSGGDQLFGTFLATNGGDFQFSSLNLTGELIDTGGHIQFVSNSSMSIQPFAPPMPPPTTPEPATLVLLGTGLTGVVSVARRKLRR